MTISLEGIDRILVPKGDDNRRCIEAFEDLTGIEVPEFANRSYFQRSQGREFVLVKGRDVPAWVEKGLAGAGLTGTDSRIDYELRGGAKVSSTKIGREAMCRFVLLARQSDASMLRDTLAQPTIGVALQAVTSFPRLLNACAATRDLPVVASGLEVSGSVEALLQLTGDPLAADMLDTGTTAQANGLVEVGELMTVYPELIIGRRG